jgi:outer membrane protein assembly factor BamB
MKIRTLFSLTACLAVACFAVAADWPQWRGPDRTGVSKETGLLKTWPKDGPTLLWTNRKLGNGFSGPAIVGDRLYILGTRGEEEVIIALDAAKGTELWTAKIGPIFTFEDNVWGDGPRSTPTVDGKHLYALGGQGELVCVDTEGGKEIWRKNLEKDLDGEMMSEWGYSESPLVDGNLLICTPGGEKGTLAALDKKTGQVVWRSTDLKYKAPYSSAMVADLAGVRQYIQTSYIDDIAGGVISGFAAKDGKVLWTEPIFKGHAYAISPTPIVRGNLVYTTSSGGCHLFQISAEGKTFKAKDLYSKQNQKLVKNNHGGVVVVGDHVYGHAAGVQWFCQDLKTGEVLWETRSGGGLDVRPSSPSGSIMAADGLLYVYSDEGEAALLRPNRKEWDEAGRLRLSERSKIPRTQPRSKFSATWTHPVVANGRLYLRDHDLLFCFDVREKK